MGLQGIAMGLLTRSLGWSAAEVEVFLVGLRKELNDKSLHILDHWCVVPIPFLRLRSVLTQRSAHSYVVHGRKP